MADLPRSRAVDRLVQLSEKFPRTKSHTSVKKAYVKFVNNSQDVVAIYWIDFQGNEVLYFDNVAPGDSRHIKTFQTHPWLFKTRSGRHMYAAYSDKLEQRFEVLHFMIEHYFQGVTSLNELQLQVQGILPLIVNIRNKISLLDISARKIVKTVMKNDYEEKVKTIIENFEVPQNLKDYLLDCLKDSFHANS